MQISQNAARQNTINKLNQLTDVQNRFVEAERIYKLNSRLYKKGVIGKQDYLEARNNYNYQKERLALAEEVLKLDSFATYHETRQAKCSYGRTESALELMRQ